MIASTNDLVFDDLDVVAGIEYCYEVKAEYPSGESFPTNEACSTYVLNPPVGVSVVGMDDEQYVHVSWNAPGSLRNLTIEIFTDTYSTETAFVITASDGTVIGSIEAGELLDPETLYQWEYLVVPGEYSFTISDTWGDGICCAYGEGYYNILVDGENVATGGEFATEETVTFNTDDFSSTFVLSEPARSINIDKTQWYADNAPQYLNINSYIAKDPVIMRSVDSRDRDLLHYEIFKDGQYLATLDLDTFEYLDYETEHDQIYCYYLKAVYDEGNSVPSNEACDEWILMPATNLVSTGTNGQIELAWDPANSDDVQGYNIYRDGSLLVSTIETFYNDNTAIHGTEYCYSVSAYYELGESSGTDEECSMWEILSPSDLTADGLDGYVHLEWTDPPDGGEPGIGDECIGYDYYYNEVAGIVDCIGQCVAATTVDAWLGDGLCDDGTWGVYLNCDEFNWDEGDCPEYGSMNGGDYSYRTDSQLEDLIVLADVSNNQSRDLVGFNIYRDGSFLISVDAGVYEYDDYDVENLETYCYTVTSLYDEGESTVPTDEACATPEPGIAPSELFAYPETDIIMLEWQAAGNNGGGSVIDYNVYRDGSLLMTTPDTNFSDTSAEHDVEYCYTVTAVYDTGESVDSNVACATALAEPSYVELSLDDVVVTTGDVFSLEASMSNEDPVAGFQFVLSSSLADLVAVNTTDRTEGFTISEANGTVVGFSLTGATIAPGDGAFITLDFIASDDGTEELCLEDIVLSDPSGIAMSASSSCGSLTVTAEPVDPVVLSVTDGSAQLDGEGMITIDMSNNDPVAGFQFDLNLDDSVASLLSVEETDRTAGFNISIGGNTILGFSLTGATVAPGDGPILTLSLSGDSAGAAEACLESIVVSDPSGQEMVSEQSCGQFSVQDGPSASVQVVHNSADPTVDVYIDGTLAVPGFEYRTATPVLTLPTEFTVGIAPAGGDVIAEFPFALEEDGSYVVVATGLLGNDDTPFGLVATETRVCTLRSSSDYRTDWHTSQNGAIRRVC